jgi:uncharacterized protein involved in response to NO
VIPVLNVGTRNAADHPGPGGNDMTTSAQQIRAYAGPALFSFGFRPLFLLGAFWSAVSVPLWMLTYSFGPDALPFGAGLVWHVHEMLFGYGAAIVAGFLLTAIPNWTGRLPVCGMPLALLVLVWVAGRVALLLQTDPSWIGAVVDATFLILFAALVWREVIAGRNTKNIKVAMAVTALALANAGFHVLHLSSGGLPRLAINGGLATLLFLIVLIGGRITPSFTRNWLARRAAPPPAAFSRFDAAVLVFSLLSLAAWVFAGDHVLGAGGMILAGGLNLLRLARWRGHTCLAEPLVWILHVGYAWACVAMFLLGLGSLVPAIVPPVAGIHAAGAGAIGVMTLAVMTRASLGHTGNPLLAGSGTVTIYVLINLAALLRVAATFLPLSSQVILNPVAALIWCAAFSGFCLVYGPRLLLPRQSHPA